MAEREFNQTSNDMDLQRLPEFVPRADLWSRIEATQRARLRRQRWRNGGAAAAAAMLVGVVIMLSSHPLPNVAPDTLAGQRESQTLESQWRQLVGGAHPALNGTTQLRMIDAALQAAYDRGAEPDELARLWQERNQELRGLISRFEVGGSRDALAITRI